MPLVSEQPTEIALPELRLVGTMALVDFRESQDHAVFAETWHRFYPQLEGFAPYRTQPQRSIGLNLFPPGFPMDMRWYYGACVEVDTLDRDYSNALVSRYLPAAKYHEFEVIGPISEISPAYDRAWTIVAGIHGGAPTCTINLELYDERFTGAEDPQSRMSLLFPVPKTA